MGFPEGCDFEPANAAEAFLQQKIAKMYTFEEIQYAWEETGVSGDWGEFVANLGVQQKAVAEIFPGTADALRALGA